MGLGLHTGYLVPSDALELAGESKRVGFRSVRVPEQLSTADASSLLGALTQVTSKAKLGSALDCEGGPESIFPPGFEDNAEGGVASQV